MSILVMVLERFGVDRVDYRTYYGRRIPRDPIQQRF